MLWTRACGFAHEYLAGVAGNVYADIGKPGIGAMMLKDDVTGRRLGELRAVAELAVRHATKKFLARHVALERAHPVQPVFDLRATDTDAGDVEDAWGTQWHAVRRLTACRCTGRPRTGASVPQGREYLITWTAIQ